MNWRLLLAWLAVAPIIALLLIIIIVFLSEFIRVVLILGYFAALIWGMLTLIDNYS